MSTPKELLDGCAPPAWVYEQLRGSLDTRRLGAWAAEGSAQVKGGARRTGDTEQGPLPPRLLERRGFGLAMRQWLERWRWQGAALALTAMFSLAWIFDSPLAGPDPSAGQFMAVTELGAFPAEDEVWLVAAELPQQQLAAMGLPFDPARAGERVPTQVLLRANGELLAVRLDH